MPPRDYILKLADNQYKGQIRNAFMEAVGDAAGDINVAAIGRMIDAGDIEGAAREAGLSRKKLDKLLKAQEAAFTAGGNASAQKVPPPTVDGQKVAVTFAAGSRRAVSAVDELHTNLIREVTNESREAIRSHVRDGLRRGDNPRTIATKIRGTYDYQAKQFRGGVVGLTSRQQGWVANAEAQLLSGDPTEMRKYLGRKLRDRRYDRAVLKAIDEGRPPPRGIINNATEAYRRRATMSRAETIGRDQALEALSQGQDAAMDQVLDEGIVRRDDVLRFWITGGDARVRDSHAAVPAMNAQGRRKDEPFETPLGPLMRPRDRNSPGSVPENVINCRCAEDIRIRRVRRT